MCEELRNSIIKILDVVENESYGETASLQENERPFTVLIEGNIGAGKSFFLEKMGNLSRKIEIITEPVEKWKNLNSYNLLEMMYQDPVRHSLSLQTYIQLTMLDSHTKYSNSKIKLMERSIYSAKYCFAENLRRTGCMAESEYEVLSSWFDFFQENIKDRLSADLIIYLRTTPSVVWERIQNRNRTEENSISENYLEELHNLYENWLVHETFPIPAPVIIVDGNKNLESVNSLFCELTDSTKISHPFATSLV